MRQNIINDIVQYLNCVDVLSLIAIRNTLKRMVKNGKRRTDATNKQPIKQN